MTIVIRCEACGSVLLVINEKAIEKPMMVHIGNAVVAGRKLERYKVGDVSFKKDKFFGEMDCNVCKSTTNATALFGKDEDREEEGPGIGMIEAEVVPNKDKAAKRKGRKRAGKK